MLKIISGTLITGLAISCAVGTEEPNTSGVLVDSSREIEVPEGLTAKDFDHNKDGTVDILDLVIASKFIGQDVIEADAIAEASGDTDESDPCREIRKAEPYSNPKVETVEDNTGFKQTFDAPNGNVYAYALLAMAKFRNTSLKSPHDDSNLSQAEKLKYDTASCVAVRFTVDKKIIPREVKVKPVAGHENMFTETIISPRLNYNESRVGDRYSDGWGLFGRTWRIRLSGPMGEAMSPWLVKANSLDIPQSSHQLSSDAPAASDLARFTERTQQKGIPINKRSVIHDLYFLVKEGNSYETFYRWMIWSMPNPMPFERSKMGYDKGAYVNMLPAEVRRRYFPEDIDE